MVNQLPAEFTELERFVSEWSLDTEKERKYKRAGATMEEIEDLYNTLQPRLLEIGKHLDQYELSMDALPPESQNLFYLACSYFEAAIAVEFLKCPEPPDAFPLDRFEIRDVRII